MTRIDKPDAADILASVGEAAYEWHLDTDELVWSDNAAAVLGAGALPGSGRAFAQSVEAASGQSRFEAVTAGPTIRCWRGRRLSNRIRLPPRRRHHGLDRG